MTATAMMELVSMACGISRASSLIMARSAPRSSKVSGTLPVKMYL
jgi:hypothetical protein